MHLAHPFLHLNVSKAAVRIGYLLAKNRPLPEAKIDLISVILNESLAENMQLSLGMPFGTSLLLWMLPRPSAPEGRDTVGLYAHLYAHL